MDRGEAVALLERAGVVHLASTTAEGAPVLRTVHGVVVDGVLAFHGAPAGEKLAALGRKVVAAAEETIAVIPSYFFDPTLACPATTYYRSAQLHGVLEEVTDRHAKAAVLAALMRKYQPEGGHAPIDADDPRYRKQVEGILIVRVGQATIDGKGKFGQNRKPDELLSVLTQLWKRGLGGDPAAIDKLRELDPTGKQQVVQRVLNAYEQSLERMLGDEALAVQALEAALDDIWRHAGAHRALHAERLGASSVRAHG